jgi:FkbM family methyltransferase
MIFRQFSQFHHIASRHPIAGKRLLYTYGQFVRWQIASRLMPQTAIAMDWYGGIRLWLKRGLSAATAQWYFRLSDYEEMKFILDFLRKDDLFVDVGANIGTFTLLASGITKAQTIAIEPNLEAHDWLKKNIALNELETFVETHRLAVGAKTGFTMLTNKAGQQNHIIEPNQANQVAHETIMIETLDNLLKGRTPQLMKIDVEGYEQAVLEGATKTLQNVALQAIIIETIGLAKRFGYTESGVDKILRGYGFKPFEYIPQKNKLKSIDTYADRNTIYIRENSFDKTRLVPQLPFND